MRRRTAGTAGTAASAAAVLLLVLGATPAHATGYRYWSYWLRSGGTWTYAQTGPATHTPKDGDVEGWRFAVSADAAARATRPRGAADFAAICGGTAPAAGRTRVALVIDPGTPGDAPGGATPPAARTACAQVPSGASSADALASVARPLRYDSAGILCAIGGYPETGCGEQVSGHGPDPAAGSPATSAGTAAGGTGSHHAGPALGLLAGLAVVLALVGAARWQSRGRRS
jgi:hypothetical protein